jgi:GT2 family glycosyltransferase
VNKQPLQVAVVIATSNRPRLLAQRAAPSLLAQTRAPDIVIVVDDSDPEMRPVNAELARSIVIPGCEVLYLENARTVGASGSWNTAIDRLMAMARDPSRMYLAILDDDDSWSPSYLEKCITTAYIDDLDLVAADLRRIESASDKPILIEAPSRLIADDFLTHNPGIQGSNLFVRLSVLLAAGGFDEAMPSTTDRDLCIRIADLGTVRYGRIPLALVDHFADSDRMRLSTPGSQAKLSGLTAFWRKYGGRMTPVQQAAFAVRGASFFAWAPPTDLPPSPTNHETQRQPIILGLVADNARPNCLRSITRSLARWQDDGLVGLDVVLLEQGIPQGTNAVIESAAAELRDSGAGCFTIPLKRQAEDAANGLFPESLRFGGRVSPEICLKMLGLYCSRLAARHVGAEVWITDRIPDTRDPLSGKSVREVLGSLHAMPIAASNDPLVRTDSPAVAAIDQWLHRERLLSAEHRIRCRFMLKGVRLLGSGSEAVVFTDGRTVYKCIDYWQTGMPSHQVQFLREQIGRWEGAPGLYALREVLDDGLRAILTYDFEESSPYLGGHEADIVALLNGCQSAGIACNNIHPENLVVAASGVKLIDYGSDIRPWNALGFEQMARRAFLSCRHASHPHLGDLMRRSLKEVDLPELAGYAEFRQGLHADPMHIGASRKSQYIAGTPADAVHFHLHIGVITSDPTQLKLLLASLRTIETAPCLCGLTVLVLANGCLPSQLAQTVNASRAMGLRVAIIDEVQQRHDAAQGGFGAALRARPAGQMGIAHARTMLQRYLGEVMASEPGSIGWLLDDDMRLDDRARSYLAWLPAFRREGVDVLIGAFDGASPNPPLNGLRVQLVDLVHNLHWLSKLPANAILPDRSGENSALRTEFPDYYYDLSRRHTAHLEMPHWLEPCFPGETVHEARSRLLADAIGLLDGVPITRPLVATTTANPLAEAKDSVNRGGSTFILNHRALSTTPNMASTVQGREARRSDMFWAILNRYYRGMTIKAVGFPVLHVGRGKVLQKLGVEKIQSEILGSTLYAGVTEFLRSQPRHGLKFSNQQLDEICKLADDHLALRWRMLEQSLHRIVGLRESLRHAKHGDELRELLRHLDEWFTPMTVAHLRADSGLHTCQATRDFLSSWRAVADDFASASVPIDFIQSQLYGASK